MSNSESNFRQLKLMLLHSISVQSLSNPLSKGSNVHTFSLQKEQALCLLFFMSLLESYVPSDSLFNCVYCPKADRRNCMPSCTALAPSECCVRSLKNWMKPCCCRSYTCMVEGVPALLKASW